MISGKISVIIPVYKVEKYLDRCVSSVVNQTYKELEVILVDDGSPDTCPELCDTWAKRDDRIRVIHKENGGLSDARNAGICAMTGDYVFFVDSDDWIHQRTLEVLLRYLQTSGADIVECKARKTSADNIEDAEQNDIAVHVQEFSTENALEALIQENPLKQTVWNKLYKSAIIKDVPFEKGKVHEDEFWTYQIFGRAHKIVYLPYAFYYYYQREGSIMGSAYSLKRLDALEGRYRRYCYVTEKFPQLAYQAKVNLFFICLYYCQKAIKASDLKVKNTSVEVIRRILKQIDFSKTDWKRLAMKERIWVMFARIYLIGCCNVRNVFGIGI